MALPILIVAAIVIRTINIAVAAPTTVAGATTVVAFIVAARWSEVALLYGAERQSVDEAHMLPIVLVGAVAVADTKAPEPLAGAISERGAKLGSDPKKTPRRGDDVESARLVVGWSNLFGRALVQLCRRSVGRSRLVEPRYGCQSPALACQQNKTQAN